MSDPTPTAAPPSPAHSHDRHHGHDHSHSHDHSAQHRSRALGVAIGITFAFAAVEGVGGWWAGSLALMGDAGHMVTDSAALLFSWIAARLAMLPPSSAMSYGWRRAEVLAALVNALLMVAIVTLLVVAAIERLHTPQPVAGVTVMVIAAVGLLVNLLVLWQLHGAHSEALNVRGALLHVIGDLLGSVAALIAGAVVWATGWYPIDPLLSLLIAGLILVSALRLLRDVVRVLMEATPSHVDMDGVRRLLVSLDGVEAVHDLHVWTLAGDRLLLSAHLAIEQDAGWPELLLSAQRRLRDEFGIGHATLQPESATYRRAMHAAGEELLDDHCH
ncbi:MAG: cation transporter [Xanthomonadales bacterium]|nr:cation transporter [Xanthomonadales bacterium]